MTSLTNKEERTRSAVVRIGGRGRVIDTSVVEAVQGATLPSTVNDAAIVGVKVGVATMRMIMTTSKTLMMAGMRGAISLDTTITILNQNIPGNGWPPAPVPVTANNQTTDSQQPTQSNAAHARASSTVGVQVTDGSLFGLSSQYQY